MINWNKYCDHIYFIHLKTKNNNFIDNLKNLELYQKPILSIEYYETNKRFNDYKYFKDAKVLDCIVDAFFNDYNKIIIFRDDLLFEDEENIKLILNDCIYSPIAILNPDDICEDALLISKNVIQYIYHHFFNYNVYQEKNWNISLKNLIKTKFNIYKPEKSICSHKIDYVIPYVNNSDYKWLEKFNKYYSQIKPESYNKSNRWNNLDNFIYNIRSIANNLKWINNLFIIVDSDSQIPEWINKDKVKIIYHKDFIPKEFLPVFNSCAIESFIYNIEELSEYFIFSNDDVFITNELNKKTFFEEGHTKNNLINTLVDTKNHYKISNNSFYLINKEFGKKFKIFKRGIHVPHAMIKSSCVHIGQIHQKDINDSITKFRNDKNLNQYMYIIYEMMIGNNKSNDINNILININNDIDFELNEYDIICIKDTNISNYDNLLNINNKFDKLFNIKSKYDNYVNLNTINFIDLNDIEIKYDKVALCAIGKNENLYIREWVEWYKNIGISKIFLYDNNDLDGEHFEEVINDYINEGFVELINVRGIEKGCVYDEEGINLQPKCYIDCYENRLDGFDFVCFFDIDEFLNLKNNYTLLKFLNQPIFEDTDTILISWEHYDDNNLYDYDKRSVVERFTHKSKMGFHGVKSIVRTNKKIYNKKQENLIHCFKIENFNIRFSNGMKLITSHGPNSHNFYKLGNIDHNNCNVVLNHYKTKTISEYLYRHYGRHWGTGKKYTDNAKTLENCYKDFFLYNEKTLIKEEIINNFVKDNNIIDYYKKINSFDINKEYEKYNKFINSLTIDGDLKSKEFNNEKGIITLTSWKERINNVYIVLCSLLENCKDFHIVLVLSEDEFPNKEYDLPITLKILLYNKLIEILWTPNNYKTCKKLIFTIEKYANKKVPIITADDDCLYITNYAQELYNKYKNENKYVIRYNMYNIKNTWQYSQGPCTLYNPITFKYFLKYKDLFLEESNAYKDDNVITEICKMSKIKITYIYRGHIFPFIFINEVCPTNDNMKNMDFINCYV